MQLKPISRKPYFRIDVKTDTGDADYMYRATEIPEDEWDQILEENLKILLGAQGKHWGLEELYKADAVNTEVLFDVMPYHAYSAENRSSSAGHTLEHLRVRYYADQEYEVNLVENETCQITGNPLSPEPKYSEKDISDYLTRYLKKSLSGDSLHQTPWGEDANKQLYTAIANLKDSTFGIAGKHDPYPK